MSNFAALTVALMEFALFASPQPPDIGGVTRTRADDTSLVELTANQAVSEGAPVSGLGGVDQWVRHEICVDMQYGSVEVLREGIPGCDGDTLLVVPPACADGQAALAPWWVRPFVDGAYTYWQIASGYQCPADILLAQVEDAWASMPIAPNTYVVQPGAGFAIAELGLNLIVDTTPRTLDVTLMGAPVTIRAVPTQYTWTNTDGTTWASTSPGKPYESGGKPFVFPRRPEHRTTFTLTTTWRGEFSTDGGASWREAPGTATTTSTSTSVHVYNPHSHLVDCDLNGNCITGSQGGGNQKTILDPDGDGIDNYLIPDDKIADYLTTRANDKKWTDTARKG